MSHRNSSWKPVVMAGAVVGLAIMGDSLLYAVLPLEAPHWGWSPTLIGLALSINRFIRLASNTVVSALFARMGPRMPFMLASTLAVATTGMYAFPTFPASFLAARAAWGVAWSGLRQGGYQAVWSASAERRGRMMGVFWGLVRLGSAISATAGGFVRDRLGYHAAIVAVTIAALMTVPLAWRFPWPDDDRTGPAAPVSPAVLSALLRHARVGLVVLAGAGQAILEATLVATAALFVVRYGPADVGPFVATVTGGLLALRWTSDLLLGPAFGALADRVGASRLAAVLAAAAVAVAAFASVCRGWSGLIAYALLLVLNAGLIVSLATLANQEALGTPSPHLVIGGYTTGIDLGLAVGPVLGYTVGLRVSLPGLYLAVAVTLLAVVLAYLKRCGEPVQRWGGRT